MNILFMNSARAWGGNRFLLEYGENKKLASLLHKLYIYPELTEQVAKRDKKTVTEMFSMERTTRGLL